MKEIKEIKEFKKVIKNKDGYELKLIVAKLVQKYGNDFTMDIGCHILSQMSFEDEDFYMKTIYGENYQEEIKANYQNFAKKLIEYGLEIGKDFSFLDGEIIVSNKVLKVLKERIPSGVFENMMKHANCEITIRF